MILRALRAARKRRRIKGALPLAGPARGGGLEGCPPPREPTAPADTDRVCGSTGRPQGLEGCPHAGVRPTQTLGQRRLCGRHGQPTRP